VVFDNVNADRVKRYRSLQQPAARKRQGLFLVEGPQSVRELLAHHQAAIEALYLTSNALARYPEFSQMAGNRITEATEAVINTISENSQGILAVAKTDQFAFGRDFAFENGNSSGNSADNGRSADIEHSSGNEGSRSIGQLNNSKNDIAPKLIAILHNVRDPGNVGTVIRAADAMGADLVILSGDSVEITNPKVVRSTAGSLFHLPVIAQQSLSNIVHYLKENGMAPGGQILATTVSLKPFINITDSALDLTRPTAWIFGNEAWGLTPDDAALADFPVAIPIYGAAESLNLATAASICLYASASAQNRVTASLDQPV
jgi:TrmH family RNA methyltransferase